MASKPQLKVLSDPERLGKYHIQGVLGEGGMGVVYRGYDPQLARTVAIKTIRRNLLKGKAGDELKRRFSREAQAEGSLVHPNIVAVYEYQEDNGGMPFFVMEYVEGKTLKDYLSRGMHFNLDMSLHIIEQLLSALAYSHKRGVIHRDIKPANILWLDDDSIKIADFGIAKMEESEYTKTGQVMGTPQYFSPEQALGLKTDARSDLYTTALLLFELLSGVKPFAGKSVKEVEGVDDKLLEKVDISDPKALNIFKTIINKALEKDRNNRYQSADEFAVALQQLKLKPKIVAPTIGSSFSARKRNLLLGTGLGAVLLAAAYFLSESQSLLSSSTVSTQNSSTRAVTLLPPAQEKINRLLKVGKLHLTVGRLILPEGSNAYHSFKLALEIDKNNKEARTGMEVIQFKVLNQSQGLIDSGKLSDAEGHLSLALRLFPENGELKSLYNEVVSQR